MHQLLACVAVGLFFGAEAPKDDMKKDNEKLQGTWKAVTAQQRGESQDDAQEHRLIFSGDEFSVRKGEEMMIKGKFNIDSSKKPKEIDMEFTEAKRENLTGKTALGIYELDGDTLKWCWNKPGAERPKRFSSEAGTKHLLVTLKRDKLALSGVWTLKEGETKIQFSDKNVVKISPHGDNNVIVVICEYTAEKEGLVKVTITGFEGKGHAKVKEMLPVGTDFSFKWKIKDDTAKLDGLKGDKVELLKSHLEGEYSEKK
jgi:uncharacterized protein (TIGR03067 family)